MNILISHVYSTDNKGDAALLGVLIEESQAAFPDAHLTIATMDHVTPGQEFNGVPMWPSFMYFTKLHAAHRSIWLVYGMCMVFYTLFWSFAYRLARIKLPIAKSWARVLNLYINADLIIPVGGGYLRTKPGLGSIYDFVLLLHPLVLSRVLGKPTVLYSQSIGPLHRPIERWMLAMALRHAVNLTILREDKSLRFVDMLGVKNRLRSVDAGFLVQGNAKQDDKITLPKTRNRYTVGVTVRCWLEADKQRAYEQAMAEALDYFIDTYDASVVFIPQVTSAYHNDDDRVPSKAIFERMANKEHATVMTGNYDYQEIKTLYDQLDFLIGTRFHSVIFSLTSYVPAIAIEYEYKTSGIMHDLGLDQWVVKMEAVTAADLKQLIDQLIARQQEYRARLRQTLPDYTAMAHDAMRHTAEAYDATFKPPHDRSASGRASKYREV